MSLFRGLADRRCISWSRYVIVPPSLLVCYARPGWRRLEAVLATYSCFCSDFRPSIHDPPTPRIDLVRPDPTEQRALARTRYTNLLVHTSPSLLFFTLPPLACPHEGVQLLSASLFGGMRVRMGRPLSVRRGAPSLHFPPKITTPFLSLLFARRFYVFLGHISRSHSIRFLPRLFREGRGMRLGV